MLRMEPVELPPGFIMVGGSPEDLDEMLAIEAESFSAPWTRKMFQGELSGNPFARFLLIREERAGRPGALVGYLCYWIVFEELRLMNLAVTQRVRRQGLATRLVRAAIRDASRAEGKRALLEVRASNGAARGLYRRLGFRDTGVRQAYYTNPVEDAALMALDPLQEGREGDRRQNAQGCATHF